jgi:hypothetical protein
LQGLRKQNYSSAAMEFNLHKICALLFIIGVGFCGSCEKHHVGELPEHGASGAKAHDSAASPVPAEAAQDQKSHGDSGASTSPVAVTPTPAEFFPESSPR